MDMPAKHKAAKRTQHQWAHKTSRSRGEAEPMVHTGLEEGPEIDGLVQERRNSSALAMELCLSCINLSKLDRSDDAIV